MKIYLTGLLILIGLAGISIYAIPRMSNRIKKAGKRPGRQT